MKFSVMHATARVSGNCENPWWNAAQRALVNCFRPCDVEYIVVVHASRIQEFYWNLGKPLAGAPASEVPLVGLTSFGRFSVVVNYGRDCIVDQANAARLAASGEILVGIQDDMRFPDQWDSEISKLIPDTSQKVFVHARCTGWREDLLTLPEICTRSFMQECGGFSPDYESMYADDDWSARARRIGGIIEAPGLYFEHLHPIHKTAEMDDVYKLQNREEAYTEGRKVFERRKALGFPRVPIGNEVESCGQLANRPSMLERAAKAVGWMRGPEAPPAPERRKIVACLPDPDGDKICSLFNLSNAAAKLGMEFDATFGYTSTPDVTRMSITETVLEAHAGKRSVPYFFWQDDDNRVTPDMFERLVRFLDDHPRADIVVGWCWIRKGDDWTPSVGRFEADGFTSKWFTVPDLLASGGDPFLVDGLASGFPCVLMRREVLEQLGARAFCCIPVPFEISKVGKMGEDFSFFHRAWKAGMKCYVDPLVKVGHMKVMPQEPTMLIPPGGQITPELRQWLEQTTGRPVELPAMT